VRRRAFEKLRIGYRRRLALLLLLAAGLSAALAVEWLRDDEAGSDRATLGQLAAKNYRTLSPQESRSLVR